MRTPAAQAAALIRKELKKNNIKGRVTSENYSMGSSVNVHITDELPATMEAVKSFCSTYQMGHFDGMTDSYEYTNHDQDIPQAKYVFVDNDRSDEMSEAIATYLLANWQNFEAMTGYDRSDAIHRAFTGADDLGFWATRKPRVRSVA